MMNNLQSSAFVAKTTQLLSTVARLRLLLVMLLTLCVSAEVWGAEVTLSSSTITSGKKLAYDSEWTYTANNVSWSGYCYTDANSRQWIQLKKDKGVYVKIVTPSGSKITQLKVTITSATNSSGGVNDITKHNDFSGRVALLTEDVAGSTSMTGVAYTTTVSNDIATLNPSGNNNTLYLKVSGGARIWSMTVTYETAAASCTSITPSLSYAPSSLSVGGTANPTLTGNTGNGTVTYTSSSTSVATVNASTGVVTAKAAGTTTITANIAANNGYCEGTATANVTVTADPYTVTLEAGSGSVTDTELTETSAGAGVTLPPATIDCGDVAWTFAGWAEASVDTETEEAPTTLYEAGDTYTPTSDITLYAVYQRTEEGEGGGGGDVTESVDFSTKSYSDGQEVSSYEGTNFSVTFDKGTNSNAPKYYNSGTAIRVYAGGYFIVSSEATITKIVLTFGSSDKTNTITTNIDTYSNGTWTGSATSVKFTIVGTKDHRRIQAIEVTTSGGGSSSTTYYHSTPECSTETLVSLDPNGGEINSSTEIQQIGTVDGTLTLPTPTRDGYTFAGWNTQQDGSGDSFNAGDNANWDATITTLYAIWNCTPPTSVTIDGTYHFFPDETITLTATPTGGSTPYTYQWQKYVGSTWQDIADATTASYSKQNATTSDVGRYRCVVIAGGTCQTTSNEYNVKCLQLYVYYDNKSDAFNTPLTKIDATTATASVTLSNANYKYYFKITDGCGNWYGFNGDMHSGWCTNVEMNANEYCGLQTTKYGTYVFTVNYSNLTLPVVTVTYPSSDQAAGKVIYFDNNVLKWTHDAGNAEGKNQIYYRIGKSSHNSKIAMSLVSGTANLYKATTIQYDGFEAWHIANNGCWSDNNSIYYTNTNDGWAATKATGFETNAVVPAAITVTPTSSIGNGEDDKNSNCEFYNYNITDGMKTHTATVIPATGGTITVSYTDHDGTPYNDFTSGYRNLAHTCLLTITAVADAGYKLGTLTVNDVAFTSGTVHTLTEDAVIKATWTEKSTPYFEWSATTCTAALEADNTFPTLNNPNTLPVTYTSSNTDVATIDANGNITLVATGTTTITADGAETATHKSATTTYELTVVASNCRWVETEIGNIQPDDEVVVTMTKGVTTWALDQELYNGGDKYPIAQELTIVGTEIRDALSANNLKWNISGNESDGYILYPNGQTANWLYCIGSNNTITIGIGTSKHFVIENGYLKSKSKVTTSGVEVDAYLGVSPSTKSWRHYPNTTTSVIAGQTLKFYKRECLDPTEVWVEGNLTNVTCTPQLPQIIAKDGGSITLTFTAADGYTLPNNVTVTNATKTWDQATGALTISNPTDNVLVTVEADKQHTITWNIAGDETLKTYVVEGSQVKLPDLDEEPTSCSDTYTTFVGWYTEPSGMETNPSDEPQGEQVTASTIPTDNATYYAVWADANGTGGEEVKATLDFSTNGWDLPEGSSNKETEEASYSNGTYTIKLAGQNGYYWHNTSNYLIFGKNGATLTLPKFTFKVSKIEVTGTSFASESVQQNIYVGENAVSTTTVGAKNVTNRYEIASEYQTIGSIYQLKVISDHNSQLTQIQIFSSTPSATGYISSCCQSPAVVTVTPADASLELKIDGTASTTVNISQTGSTSGTFSASVNGSATLEATNNATDNPYTLSFTATEAGEYTIDGTFTDNEFDCPKYGFAIITVAANPILQVSEPTDILSECGTDGTPVAVTIDSRYLTGSSLTAQIATTTNTEHGSFKICATENGTFATTDLTGLSAGKDDKATVTIYVRYDAALDNIDAATGTLTITDGTTSQTIDLATTPICGTSIRMTPTDANSVRVTTANGQWTRTKTVIHLRGAYLLQNLTGEQGAKVELTSSNQNFKFVKPDVASSGTTKYESEKITNNTWEADVYLVYTPTAHNQNETTTITAKVITFGGTTEHASATLTAYGRSFPETFVLALNTGSEWVAVPADMIAPYGTGCTTGVGNHDPYPITVDDNANPTAATLAPTRAIYKGAARNTPMTNPWTIQFESNTQAGYYLFGSVYNDAANTSIANLAQATGEGLKWELTTEDNITYRLSQMSAPAFQLGYNATANYMGQYQSTATNFKYDFRILPVEETCTYYIEPVMTLVDYTDDEAKVRIQYDGTNLYQISMDNKANWTNITGEIDCKDLTFTLPNTTYRGKDVWLKPQGTLCEEVVSTTACHIPAPVINNPGDQTFTGTVNQPFTGTFAITGSDLYQDISAITITDNSNPAIGATINNGTITVTMGASAVGTYTTNLTFDAVGAEEVTVKVTIEIRALATMNLTLDYLENGYVCDEKIIDNSGRFITFSLESDMYKDGNKITGYSDYVSCVQLYDVTAGSAVTGGISGYLLYDNSITAGGQVTKDVDATTALIIGHKYRFIFTNSEELTDVNGLKYANTYLEFTYVNCSTPTALAACPITNSSFTANWAPVADCTGNVTVDVYTKQNAVLQEYNFTTSGSTTINAWSQRGGTKWFIGGTGVQDKTTNGYEMLSTNGGYNVYSPQLSNWKSDITTNDEVKITLVGYNNRTDETTYTLKLYVVEDANMPTSAGKPSTFKTVTINGQSTNVYNLTLAAGRVQSTGVFTIKGLSATDRFFITSSSSSSSCLLTSIKMESSAKTSVATQTLSCSAGSAEFTDLSSNTTYYYTVSDGTNTSNEIAVTTYSAAPTLKYYSDEECTTEITETTVLGGEETIVYVKGSNVPACDITPIISSGYGMDYSNISYTTGTGVVSGSIILTLTDANTTEGTLTITDAKDNNYVLNIVSSDCPAGFGTMALPATIITNESAQANWRTTLDFGDDKSGTLQLYKNGIVNRELIVNGDFETGSLDAGWSNGINKGVADAAHSFGQYAIKNSQSEAHDGNYSLYVTADGSGGTLTNFHGQSVMYADYITLTPGTYRMSAWVKMPTASGGYDDKMQYFSLGIITGKNGSEHVYTVSTPVTVYSNNTYVQLTHEFEVTSTITACPAIGASSGTFRYFYLDDVSLVCTSIGQSDEPYLSIDIADLSAAGNLALTDLSGNTEYTYVIQNADGCSSNPITFQTEEAGAPVITPNDVAITCQVGNSTNGIMTLTVKDVYSDIYISNSCTERITLKTTQLPKEGGVVNFTFTPLNTDQGGETGTCTISFTTKGLSTPATGIITWAVTAGVDPDLPIIDVTDITNTSLNIEHNVEGDGVQIVISRERQEDEIEDNIGEEIFFSKYYEAYMHKKLWAIYNPTKEKISLANTYVWRSNGKGTDWNIEGGLDLSQMGNIESGYIYPNEELIVYTSDQVGECEQSKADMTNWVAMSSSDPALSFSGNDALLLVRKDIDGDADNPPTESVELDNNGDPHELNWRQYADAEGNRWWMLDIIGARHNNNKPDITATGSWTWNCNGKTEKGDAAGWYGDQGEHLNATLYKDCGYVLSTNRCLLIRKESVKSGYKAINENVGDMFTLGKNDYPTEWRGAHVPQDGNQEETSCENFTYVGGYDYESYYNAWTDLDNLQPAVQQPDGSWLVEGIDVPNFYCHPLLIEVLITDVVNGEEVENVSAYLEYKVPIVVDEDAKTNDTRYFVEPTPENVLSAEICAECDVVIRDGAKLTHIEDGRAEFRTMQVYPTAKFEIPAGLNMQLAGLHMYAKNDEVGYAIINNDGSSIHAEDIIHIKRIDDMYWYPFSLPYDCKVSSIYQINGKSMGEYWVDWGIKYYDGEARQKEGDNYAGGATSKFWKKLDASETLKAHQGYIIGLFTTEWQGQMKSIYFPPVENTEYTEGGNDAKTTYISNWSDNLTCEPRHRGWNFTGLPYISLFSSQNGDGTTNNNSLMMGSQTDDYATSSIVYVSIPDGGNSRTYTQVSAASVKLEPFKPYFVQAMDPTDGQSHDDIALTYSKGGRTLDKIQARSAASTQATIIVELVVTNADATLTDNAGVLANDRYTENYEIAADLMKMYAEDRKPQLFTRAANNEMMAYNALPDCLAQNIPLGLFVPEAGEYTISILEDASQLADAEAAYLLYEGEIVTNLLCSDYTVIASQRGLINGYSLDIRRKQNTTTNINNLTDGAPIITIVDGQIVIQQLPDNAEVQIIDVLGRVLYQQANVPDIITFQAPATGVYNVVITTTEQQFTHKTIIR